MGDLILTEKPNKNVFIKCTKHPGCWQQMQCMIEYTCYLFSITTNAKRQLYITQKMRLYVCKLYHGSEYKCMKLWFSYLLLLLSLWLLSLFCPVGMATKSSPCCYQSKPIGAQCVSVYVCVLSCGNENSSLELCAIKMLLLCMCMYCMSDYMTRFRE